MEEKLGKKLGKDLNENQAIIEKLDNAPFSIREKKGRFYARAFFTFEDRQLQKEFAMGDSLELTSLLALWQDIEKVKSGELPIDSLNKWGKQKIKRSPLIQESINKDSISIGEAIALFKKDFWNKRSPDNLKAQTTWKGYREVLGKIPQGFFIKTASIETLTNLIVDNSPPETRKREKWVFICGTLAKFAGTGNTSEFKKLKGDRHQKRLARYIPSDDEIVVARNSIEDDAWRWVFGILVAYGLRPSELFHLDFSRFNQQKILKIGQDTKTGERIVYPLLKRWHSEWALEKVNYPLNLIPETLTHLSNSDKSMRISRKFKRLDLGFVPYALRDAYAIRGAVLGISPSVVAQWMGHCLHTHFSSYQSYISEREWTQIWENLD